MPYHNAQRMRMQGRTPAAVTLHHRGPWTDTTLSVRRVLHTLSKQPCLRAGLRESSPGYVRKIGTSKMPSSQKDAEQRNRVLKNMVHAARSQTFRSASCTPTQTPRRWPGGPVCATQPPACMRASCRCDSSPSRCSKPLSGVGRGIAWAACSRAAARRRVVQWEAAGGCYYVSGVGGRGRRCRSS